ncbi:hyperosmolarity resistance protein Ebh, partial [Staphylococcus aureus]|nr:hyperosmolarity resistance protein Ebh [Staphylococcus aureus]
MNYRDKIQKFSIRKYTVGTFSTVIATLVFLGLNTSQAQAAETNQPASALKQKQQNGDTQTENREVEVQNSQNGQSLSAPIENEQPNNNQTNHVDASAVQSSTTEHDQPVSQNEQAKKDTAAATPTQSAKAASKHEQSESRAANKKENDNKATHVESHEANVVTASDSSDSGNVQHDRNELQAFFDANYHDYRFIDRENADSGTFNYVKGIFDKINTLLGSNDPINNKDLQLAYKELEQAVALIRTMPQRQQTSRRSSRIQTRSIESRAAEPRSVSDYQNANSSYYVENANDGSGYPVGTYINASSKGAPYNLPTTPWNTLKASDAKEIALITAKQTGDGYQWVIKFNKGHAPHENMIYWFALPAGQTPVGRTEFVTVNADGTNVQWSNGAGAGANKPLPEMWPYGVNDSRSWDYKIRNRSGQVIYDWPTVHINSLKDLARASDYFSEAGATPATKAFGRQTFEYINGERPTESPGVPKVYTFIGKGDASYTISFKTQGPTIDKLYYAAGGRALEYNQLFMYSQLYVESTQDYQQRLNGLRQVVNRTYRIGTTKRVEVSQGNVQTKKVLESTNLNIDDFMDDPLSYVKTPSNKVLGFYPTSANTNAFRPGGVNPLNEYQLSQLFTDDKLQQAARTGSPIRLMIGFDYPDAFGNGETLVPVNLTVLPEIQHNIKFFKNDDGQNIADKPASKQAGHPVFYVYAGNQGNASVNLGGSVTSIQPLRINLTSNENFTDKDWQITGIPRTLHIENSTNRTNNARERNIELVGNLLPGDYFGTIRFGRKEQLFEIRVKPHTPRITTTAEELRGTALQKVPVTVTDIPLDPSALVYLVIPTSQTRDGGSEADQIPSGYTKIATGTPDGVHSTITIRPEDYVVFIPPVGNQIRALIFYNNVVASNMSNAVTILPDDIPPTINNPVGLNAKYYRGDEVSFTMGVSDRHSGLKSTTITTLPSGWTSNLTKSDKKNGSLAISGRVSMNQAYNSDITFKVSATDNVNNTTNDSQSKHVTVHVGKISDDAHPIVLGNSEKVVVVNPTALTGDEKQRITTAFMNKNQNIRGYLASSNPVTVDNHGNVTLQYRDGSSTTLDATNVMTYEPVVKPEYQTANAAKTATVTIAKGQSFNIGDIKQYFTLSNGQAIPSSSFTNITSDRTIPTAQEVSQMNAGTQLYHIVATNAYHKDTEDFYITLKIIDVKQPEGDQRVYRMSTYDITTDEISKVKQAFINANRDAISFAEGDISVTNTPNGSNVSTITVNINKGRLTKSFTSNLNNMNFLRWVNFPQDYTVTWTNAKIANRPTDGGLSWSDDHKSLIYRYDATLGTQITTNDILTLLKATTTVPGLRNNIAGNEKAQAEAGGRPNYKTTGYSQSNPTSDGQRQFTLNGQVIQIMDIINPSNGFGGQPVTNSNVRANHSNSTVVSVNESAANGAGAFTIDHVVKNNSTHNAADAVYKAQLYLSPYGPKQYVEHLNQNTDNTNEAINIYFVPSDLVNPTISVGNYTNHQVFSGETFTNTITANDNFGVQSVTVPTTSQLTGTVDNNHQHVSATAPNVTSTTNKTINLVATDTSGNTATTSFNVTIKPLRDKYRVGTSSTAANPVRIANISNNATVSQADQTAIINSLTFTSNAPNRNYATASANEITSKTVSNVSRTGNNAQVTVTVTYQDGTTSTVTVPVKRVIPEIVAHSHYTVQGQDFPTGNGASASDYFKLSNGSAIPDATITWVSGQAPNKNNTTIGQDINVTAHILIDGETTPITKTATYKVVRTVPKQVFETARGVLYPGVSDMYDAKQYVKPVNNSWSTNAQHMNFQFTNSYGPSKDVVGISTRDIRVTYDNHQTQIIKILSKVKPDPPRIDGNSVTYKAGLTNQQIKINNVLSSSSIKLFKADNTPLTITNTTYGSGNTAVVTVSDALPNGEIKARSSISMNNVTYTTQDEHGRAIDVTRNESVDSNDSASVHVTPQLQATTEGAVFIKGGDGFDFGHVERFIQNPPHGATVAWHDNPDTWKNTVGNTHKTAVVTLPNGQGTRNVEVPVKVYPVANAKAPSRDVKGQNLTNGTDAINYITFDPNTNTNGITAVWANRQQPNNQQAGVQHLNVDVTYPGISAAKRVPVTVNVYQFEFPQTSYTTTVGGTLASGTQASGYAHIQNATGLPTDGFTYKWNNAATGTNDANWAAMNKPNTAQVINAKYDVIYNGHTFATSLPAKFVVKDVQPAKPTVTETAAGVITIAPGANQTVNTHAGNVTTYADKLVIKRNGNVVTTFTRHNNTSPWVKEASAANVAGIAGTNNGITVAAGTFNPADTIQAVATQGSGETISDEQRSDDFTVVAPQPNQATTKIWQNGHVDITPNNPSGHLINPTQAMDIAYTEKVGNGAEHSKTLNAVRGQNNQWTIANKPDYVTLDAHTGKVTFNANTIKPNSAITITPKAGTGHSASSNPSTLTAPAAHTVNTTEIVKDYGSNVTAAEINNAVQVANKRTATIKNGTAMPTNLAGGSTTTIPVTVTYNDSSTEEVQESIFTKADKRELITAKNHLDDPVSTDGKKPGTITQYNNAIHNAQQQINTAKTEAQQVINDERATPQQVNAALSKVQAAQTKINEAKALLQNKEDNSQLVTSKNNLQSSVNQVPSTTGMTQQSIDNYNAKKREAESEITAAQRVIDNGDATAQQISDEKHRVDNALTALNQAKQNLTADTHELEQAVHQLNRTGTTTGKKPASITAYNNSIRALQSDLTSAKNSANAIIQKPIRSVQEVQTALTNVNRVNDRLTLAINQLVPLADNSALRTAKTKLDEEINKSVTTDGMTQSSIQAYENAKRAGQTESTNAQNVINNGDATDQQIAAKKTKVEEKYNGLKQAIAGLTPDLAPLQAAKTQLQNDIDQPTSTTGMTSASVAAFNDKLSAARTKIQEIDRVLASHPDVATIRQNVTAANATKTALDQARNGLTVDKAPLENAKNQLQQSIDTQTSTTGMTQDSINAYNAKLTAARNKIQQINQVLAGSPTVDQINTNTSAANQAKSDLDHARQALTPDKAPLQTAKTQLEQSINQPTDTTGMTTASLNAYNQKLQAARQKLTEINQVLNGNPTVQNINDKVAEANQAKDQLNTARQGLTLDRQPAFTTLHGASNLNQAQQNNFTQQINAAPNHAALETIKSNITALNNAMTKLKDSVADNNSIKSGQNYTDATTANKQAYDNAVNAAKGVIGETTNPTMDVNTVNQKAETVKSTKGALDGQQNLQRAKTEATNAITHASDLNQTQKNALTQQVNNAQNVQAVNDIKQTTQSLNTAMTGLKRGVANHNQVVQSDNYVNADTNKKNDYNNAYNHANDIINGNAQHPVITPSDVNNALSNVTSKEQALNGEAKLNAAKQEANTALGQLNNLNNAQRQNLQSQINGAHQIETVNTIKQNATNLNSAMGNLRQAVADKEQVKRTEDYADADTAKQNAYNSAVSSAETIINQTTNPTMSVNDVNSATSAVTTNKNALNGDEKLAQSKTDAASAIDALPHLNNAQKADVKSKINAASNIAGVNTVKQQGTDLNTAMGNLQGAINDEQTTLNSQNYQDATPSKKTAYTNAVQAAKDILNKSNGQNKTKDQVTEAMNQVNSAKNNLDGTRLLDQAKQTAKQQLNNMTHLTTAQKTHLTNQINSGTTVAGVHTAQSNANTLDQAMNTLRQSIANKDATKASEDYHDANTDLQNAYNDAVTNAEGIISATNNPEMNPDTINQKASQVNSAKSALNGDEKLAAAKQTAKSDIGRLTDLNNAQRTAANAEVDQAPNLAAVTAAKNKATSLNTAMGNLKHALAEKDNTKRSVNYTDADQPKQQAYDTAVTQAEAITNANGSNANETQVQAALNQLNQAKNDLNGDNKVAQAKETAKRALASYSNLNNAQSTAATSQIDNATTVAGVTAAQNTANELNTAMGQLQNGINDQNTVKQQVNFTDADQGKKDAYTNAVTNAQGILDKAHGQNMTKAQVEAALNQVTTAKNALNGDANVRQAKSDAKANLGTLTHLNNAQKQDLTSQIEGATTVNGVNGVKTKAQDLDGAMQRLQSAIANKDQTKASENYIDADPTNKTAFDNAITQAESYLNKDHGANKDKQAVEQAIQSVTSTENALNGDANLQRAKTEATQAIDNLTHLNTPQKTALKQQVNAAQRVSGVTDLKNSATSLNNAMDQLKQAIADHDTIVAGGNYTNASPDKQGAYTDAYNAAKNIVNGSPNVITNAADVTAATQRVNNAETGLNGDTNLATAKQQAKDALRQMTHLSDAQKQSITVQIDNATQVTGVQSVKDNATNLDNAMNQLRNSIANKDEVKASQPYVDADRDKQNAYNTAVTSAENIINATSQPTLDPSAVTQAANQVNTNKTALNGAQNLANKKQETTANINQLSHLNNAQKQDLNTQVTNAPNISTVSQVKTKAEQLDQAMERLINGIQDKDQVKQSVNFTDADPEKQTAYNNAVTAAENIINQANGTNANQSQVEAALSTVTTTKQALNGDRKVTDAKNNANQTLSTLDNLNNAQKGAVTGNINQAHTVAEVTQAIQTAQELNTAMGNLKNSLNDKDTTLGSQNFADADPEKKNAYNEAVRNAENILNKSTGTNVSKDQVEAAMNQVNTTKAALNGTQNLEKAKQHANTAIDGLSHLTNAQKEALKQLVQQSTTVAEAQGNEQKANNVDAAMDKLRQSIADNATTKQNQNYTDSSPNKKDAYNNAVTTAQGIIDQTTSPTLDPTVINQAAGQVSTTKNALNGNENLEAAKQQATQSLGSLDNLNNAQKQAVTDQINGAHTVDEANQIKQNAQNLNTAMGNLKQAIADKDATKATVNFTDADQAKQQAYNTAVTNAENIISKANGGNATQTEVEQAIQQVNAAKQALNGNANVQHAKDEATALINSSNDLNQAQKDALKQQVQNATTVAGVNNVKQTAQELNNAMTQLKQGIADKEQTKADGNFVNADPDKQNAYKQAVAKAEALISGTPDVVVTPSEITAALNKVTQAKNDLNGNTNLATTKQNVQHAIDQLPNLNQAQRDEYSKQITQATLVPNVNAIQQAATTLNDAMTQLKQGIANKAQIKGSENYHDADTDKQTAYDNAVTKAEELLKQTTNPTMDPNTIQQALTKVNDTNQALNGNQKLADAKQAAKTNLGTLDHLNDAQKQALTTQVEQAPDIATVNNVKQNAQNLNNAMTNLSNALQDKTETLNSINFTDADQAKKDAYTNAVAHAEGILSKANGSNASQTEVEQAMQRVNEAKQALNGNDNVQRAKDAAKQVITNANDLNQAQKDALKQQVDAAQTVANVNTIKQTAQDLNQAMTQLKQGIADKDQTKANGNFVNADTDKQNAYNNAVAHAEQIISGTPNANVDPQQVAQALQQVTQAKGDLNGNHNLQVAKDNANTAIDQLPNLNQTQKTALKDQVSHAELVTGVNAIKQNADALNNAMGTLKQQIQANSQVPQSVDFTQADQDKQQAYNNAANQAQQIANGTPTPVLTPDAVTQAVTTMNQAKDALNGDEKLAQAKQDAIANLDTLRDLNQPQRDALRNQINQAQALATVEQTKQNAQNVNTAMSNLKQGIANKDTVKASENYHDADADKQTAYTNAVSQAEGIINQTTNPMLNPDDITRALTQVTDAKNGLNGEAKLATEKQNAKDAVNAMTHLNDAQKQALKGQIDQSPEIAIVNQVKQTATSLDHAMDQLSQAINDKAQTLADGNYLNADPDKQNAYKQAVAKAEALLNKQSGTNEVQAQVESITNEVNAAKQALNGNDNLANAKQQAKQQLANLTHLNDAQKQSFESQITQAPLVTDVTTINQKAQALDHAMELLRNSVADNQATLASEDYHDATAQRQNDYNQAVTATNNIINQTTSPTMNPDEVNRATTQVNNTKVALDGDENLVAAKQQANNRLDQLDHLNNAQKQQLQSQITQSSDIAAVNGHKQTAESLNTAMGNLINAIADHQTVEQLGNFVNADTDKQTAYTTAVNEAEAMINKQTGQNANQTEVEQAITKVQTTLQALNGDHNLQVAKANATQAIDALTSLNDPQKTALKDQVTAATLVTAVHQIEQNANTLNQAMHGLRESIQDNAATKANSKYINEDQSEQQNYDQAVQAANNIINEQTATLDNNAINQAATTVNTTKAALHGDVKLQNDKDHAKQTVSQLTHLNNAQKHMEDTLIDSETTRTAVNHDLTEAQALDQLMDALQQSIADKDATRASSAYVNAEPNKKQSYDEAVQNAESIIAGLNNPTINKGNVTSATQAVTSSKNALDGVERLAQDKQTAGNSLNHLDQLTPAQQQALENQINNATTRDKVAEIIAQAQALNEAMKALKESIKDQPQTEASSKFINEDQAQKDAYTQAVQHAKDLINKTTDPTLAKSIIDQATQAVTDAKNNLHGDQKLDQDKQRATETLNNLSNLNTPQRQALESQINNAATRDEVAQKLAEAKALDQAMQALRNSIQDQQQTESGSKFINEDKPQKDAYQAAVQNAKDLINQTGNPTLDKSQVEQLTQAVTTAKDNLHGDQKLARDQLQAVTTVNALPNLNHAQQQALTDAINAAPTRTEVAQHVQTATELDHAMETLKNKVDQVNTDKAQPNYTEASTDKKEAVDQALQAAESITDPTNGSNANKDAVDQALTKLQEKVNELNGNERVAEAKTQAKQTIDQLTHLNADQIATAKQNIDQATKLQPIAELVDQATQLNQSMDQLQQAVNEHANVEQTVDYTQADLDKQNAYKQAIADAENVLKQNANKQQVDQALQNILNAKQALNGDERVALAKTNGKHDIEQLNALNNAQQDGFKGRIDQSNDLNQIQQIVDEAKALNRVMDQLSQGITGNEGRTKGSTNYVNADTQVKQVYDEAVDKAKQALDKSTGQNLTAEQVIKLNDAVTAAKKALNGEEKLNNRKSEALQRLDQLTHLNNAQRQLAIQQINNAETLNKASRAINRATKLDNAMGAVQQYIDEQHLGVISSTNYINADDNLKANYDNAIANAAHELDKVQGNAIAKAEAEQLKQNIIDAQNALNGDQNLANAKDKANAFVNSLNGLNQQQQHLAHNAINNADTVSDVTDIVNNQIDLNDAMETLKHLVDNEIPNAEQTVNYQNAEDNAKTNFDDAKRLANTLLNSDNTNVNDINGAIQTVNDAIQNLNGDQRLQDAKDKAIQSINQALANKLKEIEASNATDQDKLIAKNKAEELANSIINNINKATSNQDVSQVQTAGNHAIEQVHANEIPKAKIDANKDVDKQVQALIDEIDRNPILTDKEKQALKDRINQILQQGHNDINNAMTKEEIEQAKAQLGQALQDIKDLVKAKESAKQDIDKQVQALIDEIDRNPILTDKEKQALKDRINQILQQGHNGINNAMTKEEIEQAKAQLGQALQDIKDLVKAKESAKQ